jgi:hypothetical protein
LAAEANEPPAIPRVPLLTKSSFQCTVIRCKERFMNVQFRGTRSIASILALLAAAFMSDAAARAAEIWHIKAIHPEGRLLDVKALDAEGGIHDVKAIAQTGDRHLLDVKAFVAGKVLPVKILAGEDWFGPVKAVREDGTILDVKALTPDDQRLDVKAVSRAGHILDIKAIGPNQQFYGIKAISPDGQVYDVKGIKMFADGMEMEIGGTEIRAHVKALPQVP